MRDDFEVTTSPIWCGARIRRADASVTARCRALKRAIERPGRIAADHYRTGPITTDLDFDRISTSRGFRCVVIAPGLIRNQQVVGSNPTGGSKRDRASPDIQC
jgi:hypothetical protein